MSFLSPERIAPSIRLISSENLAKELGYAGPNDAFRAFCARLEIKPVPGRTGWYDPFHVRQRLDAVQGLNIGSAQSEKPMSLVEQRRARLGQG